MAPQQNSLSRCASREGTIIVPEKRRFEIDQNPMIRYRICVALYACVIKRSYEIHTVPKPRGYAKNNYQIQKPAIRDQNMDFITPKSYGISVLNIRKKYMSVVRKQSIIY